MAAEEPWQRHAARMRVVEEHLHCENAHDLDGIMQTFGDHAEYSDTPWGEHHRGREAVRGYYRELLAALPDLGIEVERRYAAEDAVILEVTITGTHLGRWRGVPATGRRVAFPLVAVYAFTHDDRLAGERIHYDRLAVLEQLGLAHGPEHPLGRLGLALAHPLTMTRIALRALAGGRRQTA